jgi:multiple sugar transport system permease protein
MRWERRSNRKPKLPKLAPYTPSIGFAAKPLVDRYFESLVEKAPEAKATRLSKQALLFILPVFIGFSLFSWYPMFKGLWFSFLHYAPTGTSSYAGIDNYLRAFQDVHFWNTLLHAGQLCLIILALGFWIPIVFAIALYEWRRGQGLVKFLFFLPFLIPTVPAAILWKWIMDQGFGLLNGILSVLQITSSHIGWLNNPQWVLLTISSLVIWKSIGWSILIYSAALTHIDETLYEEAEMDGAGIWDKVWHVTLPSLRGVIAVMFLITIINSLQIFTEVFVLTNGGPMKSSEVIATYIYKQAFFHLDIGYASALSIILLVLLLLLTSIRIRRLGGENE